MGISQGHSMCMQAEGGGGGGYYYHVGTDELEAKGCGRQERQALVCLGALGLRPHSVLHVLISSMSTWAEEQ